MTFLEAYGFNVQWTILLVAGLVGSLLRLVFSNRDSAWSRVFFYDVVLGGAVSQLAIPAMSVTPLLRDFMVKIGDQKEDTAMLALIVFFVSGFSSFLVNQLRAHRQEIIEAAVARIRKLVAPAAAMVAAAVLLSVAPAWALDVCPGMNYEIEAMGQEQITGITTGTAKQLTSATYNPSGAPAASMAWVSVETQSVRKREDGTAATSASTLHAVGTSFPVCGFKAIKNFSVIGGSGTGTITVDYYKIPQ